MVTRDLASEFDTVFGVDSGREMIAAAEGLGGRTGGGKEIRYLVGEAEEVGGIEEVGGVGGVDLVTAGTAVSVWFYLILMRTVNVPTWYREVC